MKFTANYAGAEGGLWIVRKDEKILFSSVEMESK